MSYNESARIVPMDLAAVYLPSTAHKPSRGDYERVQLLTEEAYKKLVFEGYDSSHIVYGSLSKDFPLCLDFANICAGDVLRESIKAGLAVRPFFGVLVYTKTAGGRHAINYAVTIDGKILYFEPQTDTWLDRPKDLDTYDDFTL